MGCAEDFEINIFKGARRHYHLMSAFFFPYFFDSLHHSCILQALVTLPFLHRFSAFWAMFRFAGIAFCLYHLLPALLSSALSLLRFQNFYRLFYDLFGSSLFKNIP